MKKNLLISLLFFVSIVFLSCNNEGDDLIPNGSDPLIGNWKLKVITANGQSPDVSQVACWKDSYISIDASSGRLLLNYPDQNSGNCTNAQENFQWKNKNGVYYYVQNGQEAPIIQLLDNNQTLQINISQENQTIIFSFRK